jgi:hypothetical protein
MARRSWLWILPAACLLLGGCTKHRPKKPDPTKGTVTGIVLCADTGKPARFATVTLSAAPRKDAKLEEGIPMPATESAVTGLDGRFRIEAVEPGQYYAFATLEGYLDPVRGLDFARLTELSSDRERNLDAISQWKDHLVEVTVNVRRASDVSLLVERGAEIVGTVTYDDGTPAIGMHFQLFRKNAKHGWSEVGAALFNQWSLPALSDGHGRYSLTNLPAGEYKVCAAMPLDDEKVSPAVCLGDTFRRKNATITKVAAGETAAGVDISIPLSGLHDVAGRIADLADGHPLNHAVVRLLYADDRELARETSDLDEGEFSIPYVPEGQYILQVSDASDPDRPVTTTQTDVSTGTVSTSTTGRRYAGKEIPVTVDDDLDDLQIVLTALPPVPAPPAQATNP